MSELINHQKSKQVYRTLLTGVSALALSGVGIATEAFAQDTDKHPTVWIELGAQAEGLDAGEESFAPPFILATPRPSPETVSPLSVGHPARFSVGGEGKLVVEPDDSNWVFVLSVRYGRSNSSKHLHQQSYPTKRINGFNCPTGATGCDPKYQRALQFMDTGAQHSEDHIVMDFTAGRDVGLGIFGQHGSSILNFGVRFAQFGSQSKVAFKSDPDAKVKYASYGPYRFPAGATYHTNQAQFSAVRSFRGIGPTLTLNGSTPIVGNGDSAQLRIDWGANVAVLFGRQKARVHHQTTSRYHHGKYYTNLAAPAEYRTTLYRHAADHTRARSVVVPNVGAFAGLSLNYAVAKLSLGYRADFFFSAMDGGVDEHQSKNIGFYGPFATISVGLGG